MKSNNKSNNRNMPKILFPLIFLIVLLPLSFAEGALNDYCVTPPFLSQSIPPNVLIVLDNSGSMCDQAYAGSYDPTQFAKICSNDSTKSCTTSADCTSPGVCDSYYYGYFDGPKNYKYTNNGRWEETTDAMTTGTNSNPIASGSFLNWATMRRVEVAKKLLTGGKGNPRSASPGVTVKLDGETGCGSSWNFQKDYDTSAGNLIYPFAGDYRFTRSSDDLDASPISGGTSTFYTYPTSDISVPAGWSEFPSAGGVTAWDKVDEAPSDIDTTYIQNNNTTSPVILGYTYTQTEPVGTITVTVKVRAKQTASGAVRKLRGVLRIDGTDYESNTSNLTTSYATYSFTWTSNPAGGAWTWDQIKAIAGSGNLQGFGVKADAGYTSRYPRVTQVYLDVSVASPDGSFNTIVDKGSVNATGIIDTLSSDVRFGLAYYNTSEGAYVKTYVDFGATTSMQTSIDGMIPSTMTPLAETLYEMTRYFRQDSPYYSNSPADYQKGSVQIGYDPYWYKYSTLDASLADQYVPCAKSFVLFLTDGESTQDTSIPGTSTSPPYAACSLTNIKACSGYGGSPNNPNPRFAGTSIGTPYSSSGSDYLIDVAYWARTNDMRPGTETDVPTTWRQSIPGTQNVTLYSVYMFGRGSTLLKDAAIYGGFNDLNGNNKPDCTTIPAECYRDTDGDGVVRSDGTDDPLTYYEGDDGYALETSITSAISAILKRVSSGTAASVLASGEGSGANLVQAVFYPKKSFGTTEIDWIGSLKNLWYYVDPFFANSSIREDTLQETPDRKLNLINDYIAQLYFDTTSQTTKARRFQDTDGDGAADITKTTVAYEDLGNIWEAGILLWSRTSARTIKTTTGSGLIDFSTANEATLRSYLQAADAAEGAKIINYISGTDQSGYRNRTVAIDLNGDGDTADAGESAKVWKLGDILNSTPKISSWLPLNSYNTTYSDTIYQSFIDASAYANRGMVFAGGNDGMLHAFKLGKLELPNDSHTDTCTFGTYDRACLSNPTGYLGGSSIPLGQEMWAFIPKNVLPYLKYIADPNYCHIYSVDMAPVIFDASINIDTAAAGQLAACSNTAYSDYWKCKKSVNSWKTILIGGMRTGGASKPKNVNCSTATPDSVCAPVEVGGASVGYSSYFALDVTDQSNPKLLWEYSHPELGFATTGPAVVRIKSRTAGVTNSTPDEDTNGRWFVAFGSGPTGPVSSGDSQFLGHSDQKMRLFVLDLKTGVLATTNPIDTGITFAFAGSMLNAAHDSDTDYQDDAVYIPYVKKCTATNNICANDTWTNGGIGRLLTKEDLDGNDVSSTGSTALNPYNWAWNRVIDDVGPVTSAVARLEKKSAGLMWLYFGTGRYYFAGAAGDDPNNLRALFGIKDPCFSTSGFDTNCTTPRTFCTTPCTNPSACTEPLPCGELTNVTNVANTPSNPDDASFKGWYINLPASAGASFAERVITDPLATSSGVVFFTTFAPNSDICAFGGSTYLWGVKYNTGGAPGASLKGKALIQTSTGAIEHVDLSTALSGSGGRKTPAFTGVPPTAQGLSIISPPPPVERILHIRER